MTSAAGERAAAPPSPLGATSMDEISARLTRLRQWAGNPSYAEIARRVAAARLERGVPRSSQTPGRVTVYDCFRPGRRRVDVDLLVDIARALGVDDASADHWRQAHQVVVGRVAAAAVVQLHDRLPPAAPLVGRAEQLRRLVDPGAPVVSVVTGMAGVGKTTLALHAARELAPRFAEVVSVNLRGYDPEQPPVDPGAVLDAVLRRLGVPATRLQHRPMKEREATYRSLTAGRRLLLVLDNASSQAQVRPLLPAGTAARVLVTSRTAMAGLRGADVLRLDELSVDESLELLCRAAGAERVDREPEAARRLVELCGKLPLDLAVTAATIASRPDWTLDDQARRLAAMPRGESVSVALSASYAQLDDDTRRLFRLLALHPGEAFTVHSAAALADADPATAARCVQHLEDESLVRRAADGRYELHDLVRAHAHRLTTSEDPHSAQRAAVHRLLDHLTHTAVLAVRTAGPVGLPLPPLPATAFVAPLDGDADAVRWLDREATGLIAAALAAKDLGLTGHTSALSTALGWYLGATSRFSEALLLHEAAAQVGPPQDRADALRDLGRALEMVGRFPEALTALQRSLDLGPRLPGRVLNVIGNTHKRLGDYPAASSSYERARAAAREHADPQNEAAATGNLADVNRIRGFTQRAAELFQEAITLAGSIGDDVNVSIFRSNFGVLLVQLGDYAGALVQFREGLELSSRFGDGACNPRGLANIGVALAGLGRVGEAQVQLDSALEQAIAAGDRDAEADIGLSRGHVHVRAGRYAEALQAFQRALAIGGETGARPVQADGLNGAGDALRGLGDLDASREHHERALQVAREIDDRREQARALRGLGCLDHARGDRESAESRWTSALELFTAIGEVEAQEVRRLLSGGDAAPAR